jgi:hypothetical protein
MPLRKTSFTGLSGLDAGQMQALAARLAKVTFGINSELKVIGLDRDLPRLALDLVRRVPRKVTRFDDNQNKLVSEERNEDRVFSYLLDPQAGHASTPGGRRDFNYLQAALKACGAGQVEFPELRVELVAWTKELLKMYEAAQLAQCVVDNYFVEPRLIGRFSAKTVDNRLEMPFLEEHAGRLRSIRLGFFVEGMRRTVEARADAVITLTSSDEDDLEHFADQQYKLLLKHAALPEGE